MPLYDFACAEGHVFERFLPLARFDEAQRCSCGAPAVKVHLQAPFAQADIAGYASPVTGQWIGSRAQMREDLKRTGSVMWEPGIAEQGRRRREAEARELERKVEHTVDSTIAHWPSRKRDRLQAETEGGLDVNLERRTHHG